MRSIRSAGVEDVAIIHQLAHAIWPEAYKEILSPEQLAYMLEMMYSLEALSYQVEKQKHLFYLLFDNNTPGGFASISPKYKVSESIYRLNKLYVLPALQGKGFGKELLNYVYSEAKKQGAIILELNVNRNNKALKFYEREGFIITKEEDISIGQGYFMNDYVMQKELP